MMSRNRPRAALAAAGLAVLAAAAAVLPALSMRGQETRAQGKSSVLDALPGDTTLVLRVRSLSELERRFKSTPLYGLREHPDIKKLLDDIRKKVEAGVSDARSKLGFDPLDVLSAIEGEVVVAVGGLDRIAAGVAALISGGDPGITPNDIPVILTADAGAAAPKLREMLGKLFEFAQKEGAKKEVEDFRGGKITTLTQPKKPGGEAGKKDVPPGGPERRKKGDLEKIFFAELGTLFAVSINRPILEQTLASLTAPPPEVLARSADFITTQREVKADSDVLVFFNIRPIAAAARKNLQANPMAAMAWGIIESKLLGRSLKNFASSVTLREDGLRSYMFVNNAGASDGLLGILKGPTLPGKPNAMIPDDVDSFSSIAINMQSLYALIIDIANRVFAMTQNMQGGPGAGGPAEMPSVEQILEMQLGIKIKPVVDALGGGIHTYQRGTLAPGDLFGGFAKLTLALELKDEMPLKELLGKLAMMGGMQPQKYLDRDVYPLGGPTAGPDGPAIALADKLLVFGVKGDSVKEVIRRTGKGGKGVADNPAYQAQAAGIPPQVTYLSYQSPRTYRDVFKLLKDATAGEEISIPDLSMVADVLAGDVSVGYWKEQGFYVETVGAFKKGRPETKKN